MTETPEPHPASAPAPAKPRRGFRIALAVSLALNLLVIFAVLGFWAKGPDRRSGPPGAREISAPYVMSFEHEDRKQIRREMRARLSGRAEAIARNKAAYAAFLDLLRADSFDAQAAGEVLKAQLARAVQVQDIGRDLTIARLEQMSAAERRAYADRVQHWLDHRGRMRGEKR